MKILDRPWARWSAVLVLLLIGFAIAVYGINYRREQFKETMNMRYAGDVQHGYGWGQLANSVGLLNVYDHYDYNRFSRTGYTLNSLDYTPMRLTMVFLWGRWARANFPNVHHWRNDYDLTRWMLRMNTAAELMCSVLVFLLIRHWIVRADDARRSPLEPPRPFRGVVRGFLGALFFWFNPAVVWDGHSFPQWDVWNAPFYLGAVLLACLDWWFAAGFCVVAGAFFKGQILLVSPLFLIWPLVQLRFGALIQFICGFAFGGAVLALPWLNASGRAIIWYSTVVAALGASVPFVLRWRLSYPWMIAFAVAATFLAWPWSSSVPFGLKLLPLSMTAAVWLLRFAPSRFAPHVYALAIACSVFMMIPLFNASTAWYRIGFEFGTKKIMWMATEDTYNIPWVLVNGYRWSNNPNVPVAVPFVEKPVLFRNLMFYVYGTCLVLCGIGAAIHSRRNDPRFLVAVVTPWLCWFVLITQLNNRYLIWAAGFSGLLVGVSMGMTLLGMIVSFIGWAGIAQILTWSNRGNDIARYVNPLTPHLAWPLMLIAAIYLYHSIAPRPVRRQIG